MRAFMPAAIIMFAVFAAAQQLPQPADGMIQGSVLRSGSRTPVPSAYVTLRQIDGAAVLGAVTDRDGTFAIDHLAAGKYTLNVHRDGFFGPAPANPDRLASNVNMSIVLGEHEKRSGLDFILIPGGTISGRIVDPFGQPTANRTVQASRAEGQGASKAITDDRGEYRLYWLTPGQYNVSVTPPAPTRIVKPYDSYVQTYYPGTDDPSAAVPVQVGEGDDIRGIDFGFRSTLTVAVSGNVQTTVPNTSVNPDGTPAQRGYAFTLLPYDVSNPAAPSSISRSNAAIDRAGGHFELRGVQPGIYDLVAAFSDSSMHRFVGYTPITVGYANLDNVIVNIEPGFEVSGRVRPVEGASFPQGARDWRIKLVPISGSPGLADMMRLNSSSPGAAGRFTIPNVPAGRYVVNAQWPSVYLADIQQDGNRLLNEGLTVTNGSTPPIDVTVGPAITLSGSVMQSDGPAARLTMIFVPNPARRDNPSQYKSVITTSTGTFIADGIVPGEYTVFATQGVRPETFHDLQFLAKHESLGQRIVLSSTATTRNVAYQINQVTDAYVDGIFKVTELPTAVVHGMLRSPAGAVMGNVSVVLIPQVSQRANSMLYFSAITSASGAFRIPNVVAGSYTLVALQDLPSATQQNLPSLAKYDAVGQRVSLAPDSTLLLNYIGHPDPAYAEDRVLTLTPAPPN